MDSYFIICRGTKIIFISTLALHGKKNAGRIADSPAAHAYYGAAIIAARHQHIIP